MPPCRNLPKGTLARYVHVQTYRICPHASLLYLLPSTRHLSKRAYLPVLMETHRSSIATCVYPTYSEPLFGNTRVHDGCTMCEKARLELFTGF